MDYARHKLYRRLLNTPTSAPQLSLFGRGGRLLLLAIGMIAVGWSGGAAPGQDDAPQPEPSAAEQASGDAPRTGYLIDVPLPLRGEDVDDVLGALQRLADRPLPAGRRRVVVLRFGGAEQSADGSDTHFETGLRLARALGASELRSLRVVGLVAGPVRGHATLPVIACDQLLVTPAARLGDASADEATPDEAVAVVYRAIAARRGVFPEPVIQTMLDPSLELVLISGVDGSDRFATGEPLQEIRASGQGWQEQQISAVGQTTLLDGNLLRSTRIASHLVSDLQAAADALDLARLEPLRAEDIGTIDSATLVEINGSIRSQTVRRLESNLAASADSGQTDAWLIAVSSPGGSLSDSVRLAGTLAAADQPIRQVTGWVESQALGDAALIAVACRPLYLASDARLGGAGSQAIDDRAVQQLREAIEQIASDSRRPAALLRGLLDPSLQVYRYTDRKTGRIQYATSEEMTRQMEEDPASADRWVQGDRVPLEDGLTAPEAIALGLAEGTASSLADVARQMGLDQVPPRLADRPVVRTVEWLGSLPFLAPLLLIVGFMTLSMELSAPGLGLPGFISVLSFSLFFWTKFLSGTAEWLEVLAFVLGIACVLIEVLVLPGFGVFGIGGLMLLVAGVVLTSQTFVLPRNPYQYAQMTRNLWMVLAGCGGMVGGLVALRLLLPNTPLFQHLMLPQPDVDEADSRERLVSFDHLLGQQGQAVTPLRPAGKAQFGSEIVAVVSEGTLVDEDQPVRVIEVQGNRVVVEALG